MSFFARLFSRRSVHKLRDRVSDTPSIASYADLARAFVASNDIASAERILDEALDAFPASTELDRLRRLVRQHRLADRVQDLRRRIDEEATPSLYHELCEIQLQCNDFNSAALTCSEWRRMFPADSGAELASIKIALRRFYTDRAAADGRAAFAGLENLLARDPGHARALRLLAELCSRIGALQKAQEALSRLSQIVPDDPGVATWRRRVDFALASSHQSMDLNRSLREVEETGQFPDPVPSVDEDAAERRAKKPAAPKAPRVLDAARPALGRLARVPGVRLVVLVRGSAALVRGARAGTAESVARATRSIAVTAKRTTRRMGMGSFQQVVVDTDSGSLVLQSGDPSCAAAVIDRLTSMPAVRSALADLASAPASQAAAGAEHSEGEVVRA